MDRELLAALDACRPGESLGDDPALADAARRLETDEAARRLRDRVEHADRRFETALLAVEPPAGLADRVLARLATAASTSASTLASTSSAAETADECGKAAGVSESAAVVPAAANRPAHGSVVVLRWRRRAFVAGGLAAAAAAVLVAIKLWPQPVEPWSAEQVLDAAIGLYTRSERAGGRPLAEAPADYPPSRDLIALPPNTRWRWIADAPAAADAVAYDIDLGGGARAMLLVVSPAAEVTGLPDYPPTQPATPTTQGVCAAAWRDGRLMYVLVVEGGPREYQQFLKAKGPVIVASLARGFTSFV